MRPSGSCAGLPAGAGRWRCTGCVAWLCLSGPLHARHSSGGCLAGRRWPACPPADRRRPRSAGPGCACRPRHSGSGWSAVPGQCAGPGRSGGRACRRHGCPGAKSAGLGCSGPGAAAGCLGCPTGSACPAGLGGRWAGPGLPAGRAPVRLSFARQLLQWPVPWLAWARPHGPGSGLAVALQCRWAGHPASSHGMCQRQCVCCSCRSGGRRCAPAGLRGCADSGPRCRCLPASCAVPPGRARIRWQWFAPG